MKCYLYLIATSLEEFSVVGALQSWWRLHRTKQTRMIQQMSIYVPVIVQFLFDYSQ